MLIGCYFYCDVCIHCQVALPTLLSPSLTLLNPFVYVLLCNSSPSSWYFRENCNQSIQSCDCVLCEESELINRIFWYHKNCPFEILIYPLLCSACCTIGL